MLVLSRRTGESVMIGPDVVVTILEVRGDLVRVGIRAPRDVDVHREEVFLELQAANRSAASSASPAGLDALGALLPDRRPDQRPDPASQRGHRDRDDRRR